MNKPSINIWVWVPIWVPVFNSFGYIHRRWYFWMARAIQLGVKWHFTVVLICICLMTNVEHLCMCLTGHLFTFLGEMSVQVLCSCLELGCLYFYCWVVGVLYIYTHTHMYINIYIHPCKIDDLQIFSPSLQIFSLTVSFDAQKVWVLMKSKFIYFSFPFVVCAFDITSKKLLPNPGSWAFIIRLLLTAV